MISPLRCTVLSGLLLATCVGQLWFRAHVAAAALPTAASLARPLAELPQTLGDWRGEDEPITNSRALYADEHLQRVYVNRKTNQVVTVWGVYSGSGADRGHHPEVCLAVSGQTEDASVRTTLDARGHDRPIQQYRFVSGRRGQWVFYWHYTLAGEENDRLDLLQSAYQRWHRRPASLTLEVFAPETRDGTADVEGASELVRLLDDAVQPLVGPLAARGSDRLPVTLIPEK